MVTNSSDWSERSVELSLELDDLCRAIDLPNLDLVIHAETAYDLHATAGTRSAGGMFGTNREENPE